MTKQTDICCPEFNPLKWDKKTFTWENKPFIKESIPTLFHTPFPPMIWRKMKKLFDLAEAAESNIPDLTEALILFRDPSPFRSEIYYSVTKEVEGAKNSMLSGKFTAGVFDGPYNAIPKHIKEMEKSLGAKKVDNKDYYIHYAYCPKCAKKFGHNYVILFAHIEKSISIQEFA